MTRIALILMSAIFVGCGAEGGTQAAQTGEACADSNALDQCPPNTQECSKPTRPAIVTAAARSMSPSMEK